VAESVFDAGKPVAAICHGPWTVIETGAAQSRRMMSLKTDLKNAGADWLDQEVVAEKDLVTSRSPGDIPAFREIIKLFGTARGRQHAAKRRGKNRRGHGTASRMRGRDLSRSCRLFSVFF
jgi:protease I